MLNDNFNMVLVAYFPPPSKSIYINHMHIILSGAGLIWKSMPEEGIEPTQYAPINIYWFKTRHFNATGSRSKLEDLIWNVAYFLINNGVLEHSVRRF